MRTYDKLIAHIRERRSAARSRAHFGATSSQYLDASDAERTPIAARLIDPS